jgi:hypothetical protein
MKPYLSQHCLELSADKIPTRLPFRMAWTPFLTRSFTGRPLASALH